MTLVPHVNPCYTASLKHASVHIILLKHSTSRSFQNWPTLEKSYVRWVPTNDKKKGILKPKMTRYPATKSTRADEQQLECGTHLLEWHASRLRLPEALICTRLN